MTTFKDLPRESNYGWAIFRALPSGSYPLLFTVRLTRQQAWTAFMATERNYSKRQMQAKGYFADRVEVRAYQ